MDRDLLREMGDLERRPVPLVPPSPLAPRSGVSWLLRRVLLLGGLRGASTCTGADATSNARAHLREVPAWARSVAWQGGAMAGMMVAGTRRGATPALTAGGCHVPILMLERDPANAEPGRGIIFGLLLICDEEGEGGAGRQHAGKPPLHMSRPWHRNASCAGNVAFT